LVIKYHCSKSGGDMKSLIVKRTIRIAGRNTSVSIEDAFWKPFKEIAAERIMTLAELVAAIDAARPHGNLSSAIRLFVLDYYRNQIFVHQAQHADKTRAA
jgi:predicted DNA-binding ribbon-helix-helix protein